MDRAMQSYFWRVESCSTRMLVKNQFCPSFLMRYTTWLFPMYLLSPNLLCKLRVPGRRSSIVSLRRNPAQTVARTAYIRICMWKELMNIEPCTGTPRDKSERDSPANSKEIPRKIGDWPPQQRSPWLLLIVRVETSREWLSGRNPVRKLWTLPEVSKLYWWAFWAYQHDKRCHARPPEIQAVELEHASRNLLLVMILVAHTIKGFRT